MLSPRSIKKELSKGPSLPEPRAVKTRAKAGSKRKKLAEPEDDVVDAERQLHESVTESFTRMKAHYERSLAEMEENLAGVQSIAAVKDKTISKLEKDKKGLEEQLLFAYVGIHEAVMVANGRG
ncbi:hypothetical protein HanPI659440_Chr06g0242001 [Helianthus annuus]|nr:hypothetical protein HanHA300_Chr06g0218311 [Helianthus annuus]KAJ0780809.1 hypothetical protein HanPI659440_Chr06g0242001 [Helianthus annuus]KAJ0916034.1 hypothetical protein HanPSC8_Chr06g0256921 [Helianthus annuus]